ncbi:MAG: JAB domain-containing protein [Planctomycetes bacterium]|nr:JAB domain-containing protein [Planctomycetota bacterium]
MKLRELTIQYRTRDDAPELPSRLTDPRHVVEAVRARLEREAQEVLVAVLLDTTHAPLGIVEVARGAGNVCYLTPRDVLIPALQAGAVAVIIAHNHPSGDPTPSADDAALVARVAQGLGLVGLQLLDSIIIGAEGRHFSAAATGVMPPLTSAERMTP